jgi:hypothetical protein
MTGGLDEEQAAMDAGILDVALSLGGELFAQVCGVLVFDVLDDGVPARSCQRRSSSYCLDIPSVVVDKITVAWGVDDIQPQTDTILFNDCTMLALALRMLL